MSTDDVNSRAAGRVRNSTADFSAPGHIRAVHSALRISVVLVMVTCAAAFAQADDVVTRARGLAVAGQRGEAIRLLEDALAVSPGNSHARVLLGTVLSWEGRYDEARRELEAILSASPTHGDALPAMINVELWSNHAGRAEELASRGLRQGPNDPGLLLARARALTALKRPAEARVTLDRLLAIDPRHEQALQMRRSLQAGLRLWQVRVASSYDTFSDDRLAWHETHLGLGRATPIGRVLFSAARAQRFGLHDDQFELEMYPRFRPGTYAYVAVAYSPDAILYPEYRYAADLYQSLGAGFEASAGFRRFGFEHAVNVYVGAFSKYYGSWLFTGRAFVAPDSAGTSTSYQGSVRRYVGDAGSYVGARFGRGASREGDRVRSDFEVIDSAAGGAEAMVILFDRLELTLSGAYAREDRVEQRDVRRYALSTGVGFRF